MWLGWSKRTHRGLRTWVLYILKEKSRNGAEIMDSMEVMSQGWWRPSPGSVYPMLESMVEEGMVRKMKDGRYELTQAGKEEVDWPSRIGGVEPRSVDAIIDTLSGCVSYLEDVSSSQGEKMKKNRERIRGLSIRLAKVGGK